MFLVFLVLVVLVEMHLFQIRSPSDSSVDPLTVHMHEFPIKNSYSLVYTTPLKAMAGPAIIMDEVLFDEAEGYDDGFV